MATSAAAGLLLITTASRLNGNPTSPFFFFRDLPHRILRELRDYHCGRVILIRLHGLIWCSRRDKGSCRRRGWRRSVRLAPQPIRIIEFTASLPSVEETTSPSWAVRREVTALDRESMADWLVDHPGEEPERTAARLMSFIWLGADDLLRGAKWRADPG